MISILTIYHYVICEHCSARRLLLVWPATHPSPERTQSRSLMPSHLHLEPICHTYNRPHCCHAALGHILLIRSYISHAPDIPIQHRNSSLATLSQALSQFVSSASPLSLPTLRYQHFQSKHRFCSDLSWHENIFLFTDNYSSLRLAFITLQTTFTL